MTGEASPERLRGLFHPSSVALVGASDTSGWARNVFESLRTSGFEGRFIPVHPRHPTAFGIPTRPSLRDLDEPADLAYVLVPTGAVEKVVEDAAAAGTRSLVVLASGFGEQGAEGLRLQRRIVDRAAAAGITLLGPNGLGFVNAAARVAPYGLALSPPVLAGPISIVLQSGAPASALLAFARAHAIGISLLVSTGNEAMVTTADVLEYLVEDGSTRVIALFLEEIRQPARFAAIARRALDVGKPMVALKVGRSANGQRAALAHTGAVAGDDAVAGAALRQMSVIRAGSLEELLVTAGLLATAPPLRGRRMGVVTLSGGACDIIADRAAEEGLELPEFAPATVAALTRALPPFTSARNPLDVTGFGLAHGQRTWSRPVVESLAAVTRDPKVDFVLHLGVVVPAQPPPDPAPLERRLDDQAEIIASSRVPVVSASTTCIDPGDYGREMLLRRGLHVVPGLEFGLAAIGHAVRWQEWRERRASERPPANGPAPLPWPAGQPPGPWPEIDGRRLLARAGVPMVPAELARTAAEAARMAASIGFPIAMKACAHGLAHKSDVGAVALGLSSAAGVRRAFPRVLQAAATVPGTTVQGALISPMRIGGHQLLAGVTVDPTFGPVLAVGLGGIWTEALADVSIRVLPIGRADALEMLGELRCAPLLRGARGGEPVDLDRVADALLSISDAARLVGPSLQALEVNPLWCRGGAIEALDVLVVTAER